MTKQKFGFTLAEVLIVIGIIGVVAALTLPNLNHATGDKEKVTKVKKTYSALTEAIDRAQVIYGDLDTWCKDIPQEEYVKCSERAGKRITEFMKVSKDCGIGGEGCFSSGPAYDYLGDTLSDNDFEELLSDKYMVQLASGESLAFIAVTGGFLKICVDIDGPNKGKNQSGNDRFHFAANENLDNNILYPDFDDPSVYGEELSDFNANYSSLVTKWVIENGNLDYLKCPDKLNWQTKTSCE